MSKELEKSDKKEEVDRFIDFLKSTGLEIQDEWLWIECKTLIPKNFLKDNLAQFLAQELSKLKAEIEKVKAELKWWHNLIEKHNDNIKCHNLKTYEEDLRFVLGEQWEKDIKDKIEKTVRIISGVIKRR